MGGCRGYRLAEVSSLIGGREKADDGITERVRMMLKIIALLLGMLSPLSTMSAVQPDTGSETWEPVVRQAIVHSVGRAVKSVAPLDPFETLNGISLNDTKHDVWTKKGKPLQITRDRWTGCHEYHYEDAAVGICDGMVEYVHVEAAAGKIMVNGVRIPLKAHDIERVLGKPQFVAEDGKVFIRGFHAIKVYSEPGSGTLQGVDFFDSSSQ